MYSIIVPVYNEQEILPEFFKRISRVIFTAQNNFELIFINDGSSDDSVKIIQDFCAKNPAVKLINFSRNFGHQIAVTAGVEYCTGDAAIIMDADLQDPPELIPKLIQKYQEGFDVVYAIREQRKGETYFKKITAKLFYRFLCRLTEVKIPVDTGDFRLINRKVCNTLKLMKEKTRFLRGLVSWIGFKQTGIKFIREPRYAGKTKYPLNKMLRFSIDAITSFSPKPLRISIYLGFFFAFLGFLYAIYAVLCKILNIETIPGWATIVIFINIIGGLNLMILGIIGEYVARIYKESQNRPLYIINDLINFHE